MTARLPDAAVRRVCVAQIGGAHGVRGEVRLKPFTQEADAVTRYGTLTSEDGRRFEITAARAAKDALVVRFQGVDDRDAAQALRHVKLYVPRERLGDVDEDEFFHADLVGLAAVGVDGMALGTVLAVQNFGAGDLLEITPTDGEATVLLPFTKAAVPTVDVAAGRIVIDPPVGTFEPSEEQTPASPPPLRGRSPAKRAGGG
jgi:16S rRNA processing protein RimM